KLGIVGLLDDLEGQQTHRRYLRNSLLKNQSVAENTFSRRANERALAGRREWTRQSNLVKPIIRRGLDRRKRNNIVPHFGSGSIDKKTILDNAWLILPHFPFRQSRNQQHRDYA